MRISARKSRWLRWDFSDRAVLWLVMIILILLALNAVRYQEVLTASKDLVDVLVKLFGVLGFLAGGIASYYRFYKGRTLSPRITLGLEVDVFDLDNDSRLHVVRLTVENKGAVSVRAPLVTVDGYEHHREELAMFKLGDDSWLNWPPNLIISNFFVLDPGSSTVFLTHKVFSDRAQAVSYIGQVRIDGEVWNTATTVANCCAPQHG